MLSGPERTFLDAQRVARLATADIAAVPHVVPVCFAATAGSLYIAIDAKPKRGAPAALRRLRNIATNPAVCVIVDRYEDDWARLGWVMLNGRAEILSDGAERTEAHGLLRARYPQYRAMVLDGLPVIAVRIVRVTSWGNLG